MPGRLRWYKVESGCNGMGAALEAKLTSKAKGPVPLFLRFCISFGNPKYPRRAGYDVNYTIVFVYVCFSICVCVSTLVLSLSTL